MMEWISAHRRIIWQILWLPFTVGVTLLYWNLYGWGAGVAVLVGPFLICLAVGVGWEFFKDWRDNRVVREIERNRERRK